MTTMKRLLDEPGSELDRVLLESGLDEEPPPKIADRTIAALGVGSALAIGAAAAGVGGAASTTAAVGKTGLFGVSMAKLTSSLVVVSVAVGGYVAFRDPVPDPAPPEPARAEVVAAEIAAEAAPISRHDGDAPAPHPGEAASSEERVEAAPSEPASTVQPLSDKPVARPVRTARTPSVEPAASSLTAENSLLDQARAAELAGDREACLARISAYKARFPNGQLRDAANGIRCKAKP